MCKNETGDIGDVMCTHNRADKSILVAFVLNFVFAFVELCGGLITNSVAIMSDSVHDFGDCVSICVAYFMERYSYKLADEKYTSGYKRFSLLSALVTSCILIVSNVFILANSVKRLIYPQEVYGIGMFIIAVIGVIINGLAVYKTSKSQGINVRTISLHLLEDVFSWGAVLLGSFFIHFFEWYFIDGLISVLIAVFLLFEAMKNMKKILCIFLGKTPRSIDVNDLKKRFCEIDGVKEVKALQLWNVDDENATSGIKVLLSENVEMHNYFFIKEKIEEICCDYKIEDAFIEINVQKTDNLAE